METEYHAVRPNITDPDLMPNIPKNYPPAPPAESAPVKGLFNTMYENKIIVLIIVVVIIIILIIAYVIYRRPEEEPPLPRPPPKLVKQTEQTSSPTHAEIVNNTDPAKIKQMLEKSRQQNKPVEPEQPDNDEPDELDPTSLSDESIMQLMEDTVQTNNTDSEANSTRPDDITLNKNPTQESASEPPTEEPDSRAGLCTQMVQSGRYCRNKATNGNRCKKHSG